MGESHGFKNTEPDKAKEVEVRNLQEFWDQATLTVRSVS